MKKTTEFACVRERTYACEELFCHRKQCVRKIRAVERSLSLFVHFEPISKGIAIGLFTVIPSNA